MPYPSALCGNDLDPRQVTLTAGEIAYLWHLWIDGKLPEMDMMPQSDIDRMMNRLVAELEKDAPAA